MMPEEWPISAPSLDADMPARTAGGSRLRTVQIDFFLDPRERLTEQERALMTAMLHCLVGDLASELRALLPPGRVVANDANETLVERMSRAGLIGRSDLVALLLRRADEERIASAARARTGRREARVVQGLVSHESGPVAAAAMALILARGRRRDRFGQCLLGFDDLPRSTAEQLVFAIAAALRSELNAARVSGDADRELGSAAAQLLARHDRSRSLESLTAALVLLLQDAGACSDELLLALAQEGEIAVLSEALAVRGTISSTVALAELLSGDPQRVAALLRVADSPRDFSARLLASVGDLLGIADPGEVIGLFDEISSEQVSASRSWLSASPSYQSALDALGCDRG